MLAIVEYSCLSRSDSTDFIREAGTDFIFSRSLQYTAAPLVGVANLTHGVSSAAHRKILRRYGHEIQVITQQGISEDILSFSQNHFICLRIYSVTKTGCPMARPSPFLCPIV